MRLEWFRFQFRMELHAFHIIFPVPHPHYFIKFTLDYVDNRIPVIAGTGANSTQEAIDLTHCGLQAGADACLLVTPYYNKPTQEGLYLHHKKVAESVDIPQILYNVPGRTACDMAPETVAELADHPGIAGLKEATAGVERLSRRSARNAPRTRPCACGARA